MENSSKNAIDGPPAAASRRAHAGGASDTDPSGRDDRQAREVGRLGVGDDHGLDVPAQLARRLHRRRLPLTGLPHSSTGTRALTQIPSACSVCS